MLLLAAFSHIRTLTVGCGISPHQLQAQVVDFTTGGESHPAPRTLFTYYYSLHSGFVNIKL